MAGEKLLRDVQSRFVEGWRRFHKVTVIVEVSIHPAGNLGGLGPKRRTPTLQEHDDGDLADAGVGEGSEPSQARPVT